MEISNLLDNYLLKDTRWGVSIVDSQGNAVSQINHHDLLSTASVGKIFVLIELASQIEDERLREEMIIERSEENKVEDSGIWQHLRTSQLPLSDLASLVGATSDNWATNTIMQVLTLDAVQKTASRITADGSTILDRVRDERSSDDVGMLSVGTANDWQSILTGLAHKSLINEKVSTRVSQWLSYGVDFSMVAGALNLDPLAHLRRDRGFLCFNKTGTDEGVRADVGFVSGDAAALTYAVICNWDESDNLLVRDSVMTNMREIGLAIRNFCSVKFRGTNR